jgi:hypothetical protein
LRTSFTKRHKAAGVRQLKLHNLESSNWLEVFSFPLRQNLRGTQSHRGIEEEQEKKSDTVAREGIRNRCPHASEAEINETLKARIRLGYEMEAAMVNTQ